jgi:hypothetical protein
MERTAAVRQAALRGGEPKAAALPTVHPSGAELGASERPFIIPVGRLSGDGVPVDSHGRVGWVEGFFLCS